MAGMAKLPPTKRTIPTLSLFSGAGGLDIGFLQAGFDIVGCVEIEPSYCATLRANVGGTDGYNAETRIHQEDITKFDTTPYLDKGVRCVIGGPPCQTFSAAGRRSGGVIGTEDDRGQLFKAYCRVLDEIQPEVFVFENVYGLPGANGGGPWKEICEAFSSRGYRLTAEVVDAADYGVPQHRERLIMVGSRESEFVFPRPTHGPDSGTNAPLISVANAIADLQPDDEAFHDDLGGMYGHLLPLVPEGLNYSFFTAEMGHPEPVFAWRSKFHDLLYKVDRNAPCRTLKAQPGKFTGPFHWKNRHFTTSELKRLQTFPDAYKIEGRAGKILEQIGNSVPPRLAYVMAVAVREQLLEKAALETFQRRSHDFVSTFRQRQRSKNSKFHDIAKGAIAKHYGDGTRSNNHGHDAQQQDFYLRPQNMFDRRRFNTLDASRTSSAIGKTYQVSISESNRHIDVQFAAAGESKSQISVVDISGLSKYLPGYDTLALTAQVSKMDDVFHAWSVLEDALTARSRFFTLIDIYGHYANRGDTVKIEAYWNLSIDPKLGRLLNFFSKTMNCGAFLSINDITAALKVNEAELVDLIPQLRRVRFDMRTGLTHPIIGKGRTLCTYPFPLLSPRALVESKVRLSAGLAEGDFEEFAEAS